MRMYKAAVGLLLMVLLFFENPMQAGANGGESGPAASDTRAAVGEESGEERFEEEKSKEETDSPENISVLMLTVCIAGGAAAIAAVFAGVWVIRKKRAGKKTKKAGAGIPLKLEVYVGKCKNRTNCLELSDCLTIGSDGDCDIVFDDADVAGKNSCIRLIEGQIYIEDLNSPRGTALEGMRFQGRNRLQGGETISIGSVEFSVLFDNR